MKKRGYDIIDEVRRMLEEALSTSFQGMGYLPGFSYKDKQPFVDMVETKDEIILTAELPSVRRQDIRISATNDEIEIRIESKGDDERCTSSGYRYQTGYENKYSSYKTPDEIQPENISAMYKNGILEVRVPKIKSKKRRIKVD